MLWGRGAGCASGRGASGHVAVRRKTSKKSALVRGEPVVRGVLEATLEELVAKGYGALRVEDVAARAGVNKTTIYRRWPTKPELVKAALRSSTLEQLVLPDTGSLRGDLLGVVSHMASVMKSPEGQALRRILIAEERDQEFFDLATVIREALDAKPQPLFDHARARGEIGPEGVDGKVVISMIAGIVQHRLFVERREPDAAFLERVVDLLLHGILAPGKRGR
jgi:AcrR family transcriptional regulator